MAWEESEQIPDCGGVSNALQNLETRKVPWRRRWPTLVRVSTWAALGADLCLDEHQYTSDAVAFATAISTFSVAYHRDYFSVCALADNYLSNRPSADTASQLARNLVQTLNSWGAGKRAAPECRPATDASRALCDTHLHAKPEKLAGCFEDKALDSGMRTIKAGIVFQNIAEF